MKPGDLITIVPSNPDSDSVVMHYDGTLKIPRIDSILSIMMLGELTSIRFQCLVTFKNGKIVIAEIGKYYCMVE
jgi:hypothetical protein